MKVLHVISDENIGGAGVLLTTLLRNFDPMRVESAVALPEGSALCDRIQRLGVPICELRYPCDRFSRASVRELCRVIQEESADIVHANAALSARIAARRCGVAVLHTAIAVSDQRASGAWERCEGSAAFVTAHFPTA